MAGTVESDVQAPCTREAEAGAANPALPVYLCQPFYEQHEPVQISTCFETNVEGEKGGEGSGADASTICWMADQVAASVAVAASPPWPAPKDKKAKRGVG